MSDPNAPSETAEAAENWVDKAKDDLEEIQDEIDVARKEYDAEHKHPKTFIDDDDAANRANP